MRRNLRLLPFGIVHAAALVLVLQALPAGAQTSAGKPSAGQPPAGPIGPGKSAPAMPETSAPAPVSPASAPSATPAASAPAKKDAPSTSTSATPLPLRSRAYYHFALANQYEEQAGQGHPELVDKAIDEYKLALKADPGSAEIDTALAGLYFRGGRTDEAIAAAQDLLKSSPGNVEAHKLLGRIYLRQLSEGQNATHAAPSANALDKAIAEFEQIVVIEPRGVEERMILGQLYSVKHEAKKAEFQFKTAQSLEPASEEVVLNLCRLYADSGDFENSAKVIEAVPEAERTAKMEGALGEAYDQLKKYKQAIAAYRSAAEMEPGDLRTVDALAQSLLSDNQLDEALKQYQMLLKADPDNSGALIRVAEIERRQGKFPEALETVRNVLKKEPENLQAGFTEGTLLDAMGRYDEAAAAYEKMVELTAHFNDVYSDEEKSNRAIFLERLGAVDRERNKTALAIAAYQKMIELGGEQAARGYQNQVDTWREAKQYDKAVEVAQKAVAASPKDRELKLVLAGELMDSGKTDEGLALAKGLLAGTAEDRAVWLALGEMYVRARRWSDADDAFNKADALSTKPEERTILLFTRGEWAERQKQYKPAKRYFRQALKLDPDSAMTLNYLGYMMAYRGKNLSEALDLIQKAVQAEPLNGAYLDSLGWVYFKMGNYELAEENLRQAVERDASDPTVHDHLAELYSKTRRIGLAAAQWEISLQQFAKTTSAEIDPAEKARVQKKLDDARAKLARQPGGNKN